MIGGPSGDPHIFGGGGLNALETDSKNPIMKRNRNFLKNPYAIFKSRSFYNYLNNVENEVYVGNHNISSLFKLTLITLNLKLLNIILVPKKNTYTSKYLPVHYNL